MKTPRCSLPDLPAVALARRRRQAPALTKWNKRNLSWRWAGLSWGLGSQNEHLQTKAEETGFCPLASGDQKPEIQGWQGGPLEGL